MAGEIIYGYFMQHCATTHIVHYIINVTNKVSEDRLIVAFKVSRLKSL
jgi:hypothetical protein